MAEEENKSPEETDLANQINQLELSNNDKKLLLEANECVMQNKQDLKEINRCSSNVAQIMCQEFDMNEIEVPECIDNLNKALLIKMCDIGIQIIKQYLSQMGSYSQTIDLHAAEHALHMTKNAAKILEKGYRMPEKNGCIESLGSILNTHRFMREAMSRISASKKR